MGPGDPFGKAEGTATQARPASTRSVQDPAATPREPDRIDELLDGIKRARESRPAVIGMGLGALIGVLLLFNAIVEGLFVLVCAAAGGVVAYVGHGLLTGRFDLGAAWRALREGK